MIYLLLGAILNGNKQHVTKVKGIKCEDCTEGLSVIGLNDDGASKSYHAVC